MPPADRARSGTAAEIVAAAFASIEEHGLDGLTIRGIAAHAGVNVAAVNYHFGSKDRLLAHVLEQASANAFRSIEVEVPSASGPDLDDELRGFLGAFVAGLAEFPNTSRVLIHRIVVGGPTGDRVGAQFAAFLEGLAGRVATVRGVAAGDMQVRLDVAGLVSSLIAMALMPAVYAEALGLDLADAGVVAALIDSLVPTRRAAPDDADVRARPAPRRAPSVPGLDEEP